MGFWQGAGRNDENSEQKCHVGFAIRDLQHLAFTKQKVAIFVDGDFWHGYAWEEKKPRISRNREYWIKKIEGNIERDKKINQQLKNKGWVVLRFWSHEIKNDLEGCAKKIIELIKVSEKYK